MEGLSHGGSQFVRLVGGPAIACSCWPLSAPQESFALLALLLVLLETLCVTHSLWSHQRDDVDKPGSLFLSSKTEQTGNVDNANVM